MGSHLTPLADEIATLRRGYRYTVHIEGWNLARTTREPMPDGAALRWTWDDPNRVRRAIVWPAVRLDATRLIIDRPAADVDALVAQARRFYDLHVQLEHGTGPSGPIPWSPRRRAIVE